MVFLRFSLHFPSPSRGGPKPWDPLPADYRTSCWQSEVMVFLWFSLHFPSPSRGGPKPWDPLPADYRTSCWQSDSMVFCGSGQIGIRIGRGMGTGEVICTGIGIGIGKWMMTVILSIPNPGTKTTTATTTVTVCPPSSHSSTPRKKTRRETWDADLDQDGLSVGPTFVSLGAGVDTVPHEPQGGSWS